MAEPRLPILFVHGSGDNAGVWHNQLSYLSKGHLPLAMDLPGHGEAPGDPQPDIEYYADAIERYIEERQLDRPVLAGHSLGGGVILTAALRRPAAYRGLVLVGTGARLRVLPEILEKYRTDYVAARALSADLKWAAGADPEIKEQYARIVGQVSGHVYWCDFSACDKFDAIARMKELTMPALAIVGAEDRLTPVKYAQFFEQNLPQCELLVIPNAGHMVAVEQPAAVNEAIDAFMSKLG